MEILTGLFDHMVLQRTSANASAASFTGKSAAHGGVFARITHKGHVVSGFDRVQIGHAAENKFAAGITGLPVGGPYAIELAIQDAKNQPLESLTVGDVLVGDVWILAGQSNMQGYGLLKFAAPAHDRVRAFYMDDRWAVARDPVHNLWDCVDQVHVDLCGGVRPPQPPDTGCGPGVAFARQMHQFTGVPQGLLACAHGGTSMQQWDPSGRDVGGKSLYGALLRRFAKNGGKVAGIVWYQGESDANADAFPKYSQRMQALVAALRKDLNAPTLPLAMVQISRVVGWEAGQQTTWNGIQEMQRKLPDTIDRCAVVPAIDLPMDDVIHIGGDGPNRLGKRLANAMWPMIGGDGKPPIALKSVTLETDPGNKLGRVIVEFNNVEGALSTGVARAVGFALVDAQSHPRESIYHTDVEGNRAIIHLMSPAPHAEELSLYYGFGMDPICNITDEADRSLPVFGPIPLGS